MRARALIVLLLCCLSTGVLADVDFVCPGGSWSTAKCWWVVNSNPPVFRLPNDGETAYVDTEAQVTLDISASPGVLYVGSVPRSTNTFLQPANSLQAADENLGPFGGFTQTGGTNAVANQLLVESTYNLQGGSLMALKELVTSVPIGASSYSAASFVQTQGTNTVSDTLYLAGGPPVIKSTGNYNLHGGRLSASSEVVGGSSIGTFMQDGGTNSVQDTLTLADLPGTDGTYILSKEGSLSVHDEEIGRSGKGSFQQNGGTHTNDNFMNLGTEVGSDGTYSLALGFLQARYLGIGGRGNGHFLQSGGRLLVNEQLTLDALGGGTADYVLSGNASLAVNGDENIGIYGNGTFTQSGETEHTVAGNFRIGIEDVPGTALTWVYNLNGGELKPRFLINYGVFNFSGGRLQGDIENDGVFAVHGPAFRYIVGNLYNNGTLKCDTATVLAIAGTYTNRGIDSSCFIIQTTLFNP